MLLLLLARRYGRINHHPVQRIDITRIMPYIHNAKTRTLLSNHETVALNV